MANYQALVYLAYLTAQAAHHYTLFQSNFIVKTRQLEKGVTQDGKNPLKQVETFLSKYQQIIINFLIKVYDRLNSCQKCDQNYGVYSNPQILTDICIYCGTGCSSCIIQPNPHNTFTISCLICTAPYILTINYVQNTNGTQRVYYYSCSLCQLPCITCPNLNQTACSECLTGFYINYVTKDDLIANQCYLCNIQNCIACTSPNFCVQCQIGYYVKLSFQTNGYFCEPCPIVCISCLAVNITLNLPPQCTVCTPGYALQNGNCIQCLSPNCFSCNPNNLTFCIQSNPGYIPDPILGEPCINSDTSNCNVYSTNNISSYCLQCSSGYSVTSYSNGNCFACSPNCFSCTNQSFCNECLQTFYLVVQQSKYSKICRPCPSQCLTWNEKGCIYCANGYYPAIRQNIISNQTVTVQCNPCNTTQGCLSCYNELFCLQCTTNGFSTMPNTQGNCIPCGYGCITCDNQQVYSVCKNGFLLNVKINKCLQVAGLPIWVLFVMSFFGFTLIFILAEKFIRSIKRAKQQKLLESESPIKVPVSIRPFPQHQNQLAIRKIKF